MIFEERCQGYLTSVRDTYIGIFRQAGKVFTTGRMVLHEARSWFFIDEGAFIQPHHVKAEVGDPIQCAAAIVLRRHHG